MKKKNQTNKNHTNTHTQKGNKMENKIYPNQSSKI